MSSDLANASKGALVRKVETLNRQRQRQVVAAQEMGERVADVIGTGLAGATGAVVGYAEGRFRNKDRTPLSVGPAPLPLAVGAVLAVGALATGRRALAFASAGALGAYGYNIGKGAGAASLAKQGTVSGIGEDGLTLDDEEAALLYG